MNELKRRLARLEARIGASPNSFEDDCAACAWFADALETRDSDKELAPKDKAIWDDIFINRIDSTKAWKKWQN